jgi:hypothetical protein
MALVAVRHEDIPREVSRTAVEIVIETLSQSLASGRPVALRGFGRLIPRRYERSASKRFGLLFHPSPRLIERVNPHPKSPRRPLSADGGPSAPTGPPIPDKKD